jgi:hypothetical protein
MSQIEKMRARMKEIEDKKAAAANGGSNGPSSHFPFRDIPTGGNVRIRLLQDGDTENPWFWREKAVIKLPFPGVKGVDETKEVLVNVPCVTMFGEKCPILAETSPWWKGDADAIDLARKYKAHKTYIYQGVIIEGGAGEVELPENPVRIFTLYPSVHTLIKNVLLDPEMANCDVLSQTDGTDFIIRKTKAGEYADYSTSAWARRSTSLTEAQLDAIKKHGLYDLSKYIPEVPNAEARDVIFDMFKASLDGELYDPTKWAAYFKPWGLDNKTPMTPPTVKVTAHAPRHEVEENDDIASEAPAPKAPAPKATTSASDILAQINNRKKV